MKARRDILRGSAALALIYAAPPALLGSARAQPQDEIARQLDVPYVPTPMPVVDAMLDLAKVTKSDLVTTSAAETVASLCAQLRVSAVAASARFEPGACQGIQANAARPV